MKLSHLSFGLVFVIAGCSSILQGPTQSITLLTPGAENAECMMHNDDFRYEMTTGETRSIQRSEHDMIVDCYAPGNRQKSIIVENYTTAETFGNIVTAGAGAVYDYYDNAMFEYPAVVSVDFRDVPAKSYGLPGYHSDDLPDPATLPVEDYGPKVPKKDIDRMAPTYTLKKIERDYGNANKEMESFFGGTAPAQTAPAPAPTPTPLPPSDSAPTNIAPSKPGTTADELTRSMNPHVFQ